MKIKTTGSIIAMLFVLLLFFSYSTTFAAPLNLSKSDGLNEEWCMSTGETVNYTICYNNLPNAEMVTGVMITDNLPTSVDFVSADNGGVYDGTTHSVTWDIGSLDAGAASSCVLLSVDTTASPGSNLYNTVTINSNETEQTVVEENTAICPVLLPLNLNKSDGLSVDECVTNGETIDYSICYDNLPNADMVTGVMITDILPAEVNFVTADNGGTYDSTTHTVTWDIGSLDAEAASSCVLLSVDAAASSEVTLSNLVAIDSNETDPTVVEENTRICTIYYPLNLSKNDGLSNDECTISGQSINYSVCYDNLPNTEIITGVTLTDILPDKVNFVSADNNGSYDSATHSVTWDIGSLDAGAASSCVNLSVDATAPPGAILSNMVTLDSNEAEPTEVNEYTDICPVYVHVDIKPGGCPTPINVGSKGVLPVAVLGTADFDVTTIHPQSITLAGVSPLRWSMEDVGTPHTLNYDECDIHDCNELNGDGYVDLTLKFDTQQIAAAIAEVYDRECLILELTGQLKAAYGSLPIEGGDVVSILKKGKKHNIAPTTLILLR